ncbi:MAG: hypothetical protein ACWA42_06795 [Lutibacter sp.]
MKINKIFIIVLSLSLLSFVKLTNSNVNRKEQLNSITQTTTISGKYVRVSRFGLYKSFKFIGKSTCIIHSVGMDFTYSYERDGNLIRVNTNKSDLLLKIKNSSTLVGQGYAKGTYVKK